MVWPLTLNTICSSRWMDSLTVISKRSSISLQYCLFFIPLLWSHTNKWLTAVHYGLFSLFPDPSHLILIRADSIWIPVPVPREKQFHKPWDWAKQLTFHPFRSTTHPHKLSQIIVNRILQLNIFILFFFPSDFYFLSKFTIMLMGSQHRHHTLNK